MISDNSRDYLLGYLPNDFNVMSYADTISTLVVYATGSIDEACLGREISDSRPVEDLSNLLANTAIKMKESSLSADPIGMNVDPIGMNVDPIGMNVLWNTLKKYRGNKNIKNTDELALKISFVAQELKAFRNLPIDRLKTLRGFCLDLSKEIGPYLPVIHA